MENDEIKQFLDETIQAGGISDEDDIIRMLNFLGTMSIGCRKLKLDGLADLYSKRLSYFTSLISKFGYKHGKRLSGTKTPGLANLLSKAFYNLRIFGCL
jgi:hypothetical protein